MFELREVLKTARQLSLIINYSQTLLEGREASKTVRKL
jgi:hypothetical protein